MAFFIQVVYDLGCGMINLISLTRNKKMQRKILYITIFTLFLCLLAGYFFASFFGKKPFSLFNSSEEQTANLSLSEPPPQDVTIKTSEDSNALPQKTPEEKPATITQKIEQSVPFIAQAPFGNWGDPNFQNACEEASIVMAMGWVKDEKNISPQEAQKRILEIIDFENKNLGYSVDTDTADMEKIFREYFKHKNVTSKKNITLEDLKAELQKDRIVIVPAFGRALSNPNFTQPGPIAHMLVLIGYDPKTQEFITNDPGTKKGANYRYAENVLFTAIWEYPSGPNNPPLPAGKKMKAMISVGK